MKKHLILALLFSMAFGSNAFAESYIYLTNSTTEPLSISTVQTGHDNITHGNEWEQLAHSVPPMGTVKFLRFNRDRGIKWGKKYWFTTTVQGQSSSVVLQQKLKGTMTFSNIKHSANYDSWKDDRDIYKQHINFDGQDATLAYKASYARASGDDFHYIIQPNLEQQVRDEANANSFNVLTYNIWGLLPGITAENTYDRFHSIAHMVVPGYDAIVFQEAHDLASSNYFRDHIKGEYPYLTEIPFELGRILNGGIFIASKWPIEVEDNIVYQACIGEDCLASKGAVYAKINKLGKTYNLFGTHVRAYTTPEDIANRFEHLAELKAFKDSKHIPANEPVIYAGDFNVDKVNFPQERDDLMVVLDATEPTALEDYPYSYGGSINVYADDQYDEYLDYVLYSNEHVTPISSSNTLLLPRSVESEHWGRWDLSDHFPVKGEFVYP
ncbi:MAG: sphingomyelin phosphodiesterase [Oleiphilaceae bacterium]|nr:sphingomyelin phosphodiesterase [Oleiphilaceae bacterium]